MEGASGSSAAAARAREARRKGARLTRTEKGSVCAFRTPSEPEKVTCDLLTLRLEFNSTVVSQS